jgi:membrane-associated protease RseP (regulator of RpoE activity)
VTATAHGYAPSAEAPVVLADEGEPSELELALGRGGTIVGLVTSGERGRPIDGARVSLEGRLGGGGTSAVPLVRSATTDIDGRFEIGGVPEGSQSLFVAGANHHARVISGVTVAEGARVELTIDLTPTEPGEEPRVELAGIGIVLTAEGDVLLVGRVVEGGGAAEAGIVPNDAILAVDGTPVTELGFQGSIERLRGPEGSTVMITVRRAGTNAIVDLRVPRRRIRA